MSGRHRSSEGRQHARAPVTVEVHYRTTGSFLVSYSLNLSTGGLFLETDQLLPAGTQLIVRFTVPGAEQPVETAARVVWVRERNLQGLPVGFGIQFDGLEDRIGALIDKLARDFAGVKMTAVAADSASSERLARYLHSILSCDVRHATPMDVLARGLLGPPDLVLLDLDSAGPEGFDVIDCVLKQRPAVPLVVATSHEGDATNAATAGVEVVVGNPPSFERLRRAVLEVIARPSLAAER